MENQEVRLRCLEMAVEIRVGKYRDLRYWETHPEPLALDIQGLADRFVNWVRGEGPGVSGTGAIRPNAGSSEKETARPSARA